MTRAQTAVQSVAHANKEDERAALNDSQGRIVPYVQTAHSRVSLALRALRVTADDVFVDLGCGDGRLTLAAAADFGATAVGIEISPSLLRCCRRAAKQLGFSCDPDSRVRFLQADFGDLLFEGTVATAAASSEDAAAALDVLQRATVIYVYTLPAVTAQLTPFLLRAVARGARVMTLEHHLPPRTEPAAVSMLPADCVPLEHFLVPVETHLFGRLRLYCSAPPGPMPGDPHDGQTRPPSQGKRNGPCERSLADVWCRRVSTCLPRPRGILT